MKTDYEWLKERRMCGACKHWHEWDEEKQEYKNSDLGDCDKIPKGKEFSYTLSDGEEYTAQYDGYSFEDECYDEEFGCYESGVWEDD